MRTVQPDAPESAPVRFPQVDHAAIDADLEREMDFARKVVPCCRAARNAAKVKTASRSRA